MHFHDPRFIHNLNRKCFQASLSSIIVKLRKKSIMRLVRAYNDLLILIPKSLNSYAPNDTSSSDDDDDGDDNDQEDIVSLGRSSSIGASASSIYSNIFSNASR